jgi:ubiquinone/menaquinone biosynthesis C-methylase UbiE
MNHEGTATYALGASDHEIARLDQQAASIDAATRVFLRAAGIGPGMRVLDLGTGLGHVAALAAELVGPQGRVVGVDNSARLLEVAAARAAARPQLRFVEGDVRTWRDDEAFDVVVGRLILFHLNDPVCVLRHHVEALRPGGLLLALDFDIGAARTEPDVPEVAEVARWVVAAFRRAGASPAIGTRLQLLLEEAGLAGVQGFGIQGYLAPGDPRGPALLSAVAHSLAPHILAAGLATPEQIDPEPLRARLADAVRAAGAVFLPPVLAGAWGRRA